MYAVATKDHVTSLNTTVREMDLDPICKILYALDSHTSLDERCVGQSIMQDLQEVASLERKEPNTMTYRS